MANVAQNIEYFSKARQTEWNWINETKDSFSFAASLYDNVCRRGNLTINQLAAVNRCIERKSRLESTQNVPTGTPERIQNAPTVVTDKLFEAFQHAARSKLKHPKLRFDGFEASLAPATGRNPGAVYIKDQATYLGKIQNGRFFASAICPDKTIKDVSNTMADPLSAMIAYGRRSGNCACCGKELTVAESVERGIGPICFSKYFD